MMVLQDLACLTAPVLRSPPIMNTQGNGQFYVQNTSLCNPASSLQAAAGSSVATFVKNFTSALPTCTAAPSPAPGPAYPPPAAAAVLVPPPAAVVASTKSSGSSSSAGPIAGGPCTTVSCAPHSLHCLLHHGGPVEVWRCRRMADMPATSRQVGRHVCCQHRMAALTGCMAHACCV